jgi:exodeoxyribonuclease V beta subunit
MLPWRTHSFSAWLAASAEATENNEFPDHDARANVARWNETEAIPSAETLPAFPAGATAGTCLHALFERANFSAPDENLISDTLAAFGFGSEWKTAAGQLMVAALATPLAENLPPLARISYAKQIREMEFMLPIRAPDMAALAAAIDERAGAEGSLAERVRQLDPARLSGFLKGFIDLVFEFEGRYYVVDYKSNHLGVTQNDYAAHHLAEAMSDALYDLQALLYTLALHLFLQTRLPDYDYDTHCGGALYLFLRGMNPDLPGSGVFSWRPSREMILRVEHCLSPTKKMFA